MYLNSSLGTDHNTEDNVWQPIWGYNSSQYTSQPSIRCKYNTEEKRLELKTDLRKGPYPSMHDVKNMVAHTCIVYTFPTSLHWCTGNSLDVGGQQVYTFVWRGRVNQNIYTIAVNMIAVHASCMRTRLGLWAGLT